ncbi:protein DEHYDRATION-INDUCED 194-like [Dorcoceras hygrometricum]|uniref:Protein DEHYDRATION-INDUCED 194-like n=1 Tax=Dorcoceras hygrometricum TaxID=472368 RepID=A0A2Z7BLE9_9LAMI|nr:protein DEHYDRATION-INDUCED 194-like [Dorcoceras hygrometricum]
MVIGSLATLDLPMVVDLIGIYVLKGPYCTLTMTNWFFQALSVIPRGSWGDVPRRFTMIRWASPKMLGLHTQQLYTPKPRALAAPLPPFSLTAAAHLASPPVGRRPPPSVSIVVHLDEEIPSVKDSSRFLVQTDEGIRPCSGRRALRPLAGHPARMSRTVLRGTCRPPASALRAGGRPRAHALRTGARGRTLCRRQLRGGVATAVLTSMVCFGPVPDGPRGFRANI